MKRVYFIVRNTQERLILMPHTELNNIIFANIGMVNRGKYKVDTK